MGQKANPVILKVGRNQDWKSKYFEKKPLEVANQTFKDFEIKRYVQQIFKNYGLIVQTCKLNYTNFSLHIFVSYYLPSKFVIKPIANKSLLLSKKINLRVKLNSKKYLKYQELSYKKTLKNFFENRELTSKISKFQNKSYKHLKQKELLNMNNSFRTINLVKSHSFVNQMTEGLGLYTHKKLNILVTFQQLNKNLLYNQKTFELIKRKVLNLRRFEKSNFFNEGIATIILCITQKDSARLLAEFIAIQLKTQKKRHNLLLRFLKNLLAAFCTRKFSILKGIQVQIKGRFNRAARAKHRTFKIGQVPIINLDSKISYSEAISFAQNGTFGIKVWLIEK